MKATAILSSDLLDILFEERNKSYGAYVLRKQYGARLLKAIFGMLAVVTALSFIYLQTSGIKPKEEVIINTSTEIVAPPRPDKPEIKKPELPQPLSRHDVPTYNANKPVIVPNARADSSVPDISIIDDAVPGDVNKPGNDRPTSELTPDNHNAAGNPTTTIEPEKPIINKEIPVDHAEVEPSFPGGMAAFVKFLKNNLQSPEEVEAGNEVAVKVKFIVNYDGSLKSFQVVQSGGEIFDEEVIRVLKKMPRWIPGKTSGIDVSVFYTVPVMFKTD